MEKMRECIVIGGGPAGISAGIYLARKKIGFSIITENVGGADTLERGY